MENKSEPTSIYLYILFADKSTDENQDDNGKAAETNSADSDISMCQVDVFEDDDDTSFLAFNRAKLGIRVLCECEEVCLIASPNRLLPFTCRGGTWCTSQ